MKTVWALMLICFAAVSAKAGDSAEMRQQRLIIRDQLVIEEPHSVLSADFLRCCCRLADRCDHRTVDDPVPGSAPMTVP